MVMRLDSALEVKFVAETGVFEGYASVFDVTDSVNDRIAPGAFAASLRAHAQKGQLPPLLWQHDAQQPIGAWREIYEDGHGLFVRGDLFIADIARAREAYRLVKESVVSGLSIGYRVRQSHRDAASGVRVLTEVELLEISMVTFPANAQARVTAVKSSLAAGQVPSERDFEAFLREAGLSRRQAKGVMALGYKSLLPPREAGAGDDAAALRLLAQKIRSLC